MIALLSLALSATIHTLLKKDTQRVVPVVAKGGDAGEPPTFIQADGFGLVDAGFQAQDGDTVLLGVRGQLVEYELT